MDQLNTMLQDAKALLKTARKYETAEADGIDPELAAALATAVERTVAPENRPQVRDR
jgi:hypothetical protein